MAINRSHHTRSFPSRISDTNNIQEIVTSSHLCFTKREDLKLAGDRVAVVINLSVAGRGLKWLAI